MSNTTTTKPITFYINCLEIRWLYEETFNEASDPTEAYSSIANKISEKVGLKQMKTMLKALRAEESTNPLVQRKFIGDK